MNNNITLNEELQEKLLNGVEQVSAVIRSSYGPKGGNVSIEMPMAPGHMIVNDADSIIQSIYIEDPVERRALNFLKELSSKVSKISGEGRKTTIIIAEEILKGGFKEKVKGMKLKEELDALLPQVLENIDKQSRRVELNEIGMVAQTSSRSQETGEWIQKIYNEIDRDGIIQVEGSGSDKTSYEVTNGVLFRGAGALTEYMYHDPEAIKEGKPQTKAVYENPIILVAKKKIDSLHDINTIFKKAFTNGERSLVIFTDDMDNKLAFDLVEKHRSGKYQVLVVRCPVIFKNYLFEDFAKCVGATIVEDSSGVDYKNLAFEHFGTCDKITSDKEETVLMGIKDISAHKANLKADGSDDSLRRLEWLNTKTAVLRLGANSESELSYKRLKAQDAVNACRLAMQDGVVKGAGWSLIDASNLMDKSIPSQSILWTALREPSTQLIHNNNDEAIDPIGIYDATAVIKNAIKSAVGLAGMILSLGGDIRFREASFEDKQLEILYKQKNPFSG